LREPDGWFVCVMVAGMIGTMGRWSYPNCPIYELGDGTGFVMNIWKPNFFLNVRIKDMKVIDITQRSYWLEKEG
jgi:hypothetical protein